MFDLKLFTKQDSVVGSLQPVAQLDIFNRRIAIRFIETVEREENIAADRAAARRRRSLRFGRRLGPAEILKTLLELLAAVMDRHDDRNGHVPKRGRGLRFL
jgi:hypothetical protein